MFLLLLSACLSPLPTEVLADLDQDGLFADEDCDDQDPSIYPGAEEICDGIDNDCDGQIDEDGLSTFYVDSDGDGFGDASDPGIEDCALGEGYSLDNSDCDDSSAAALPGGVEVCDGLDNDCDGRIDQDASDALSWYEDADGDGFGADDTLTLACEPPDTTWTADPGDCLDSDPQVNPNEDEICDGIDNDCDGSVDLDALDGDPYYADRDGDGFGDPASLLVACEQPSDHVTDSQDCNDGEAQAFPGAAENESDVACMQDVDGDGYGDSSPPTGVAPGADCDDTEPSTYGGAPESPADGVDSDCDGEEVCYRDDDADGFGGALTAGSTDLTCSGSGFATTNDDCDDRSALTFPGAAPNDSTTACMADLDGDDWGDSGATTPISAGTDCNDDDAAIYPGASETTADGIDQDCSGGDTCYVDSDGDDFGSTSTVVSSDLDCSDSGEADNADDCNDGDDEVNPDASEAIANGSDDDCDGYELCYDDADGDGYAGEDSTTTSSDSDCSDSGEFSVAEDCDDSDATAYPGASETTADGIDQDCDGGDTCYVDSDGDDFGSTSTVASSDLDCSDSGEADNSDDCNDGDKDINPDEAEIVGDGTDQDCDGGETCYADVDLDGYGGTATLSSADTDCSDAGEDSSSDDCDDSDATVYPGASETTADGIDQDCDGGDTCYLDSDGDGYGSTSTKSSSDLDCTDGKESTVNTDCDDGDSGINPGASEVPANGSDDDCDTYELCYADSDGDGFAGETSTVSSADTDCTDSGEFEDADDCDDADVNTYPGAAYNEDSKECMTDADGDGYGSDSVSGSVSIGTDCDDGDSSVSPGETEICNDGIDNDCSGDWDECVLDGSYDVSSGDVVLDSSSNNMWFGNAMAAGDFDNDGTTDLVVAAMDYDAGSNYDSGAAFLFNGPITADATVSGDEDVRLRSTTDYSYFGWSLASGDLDGDGIDDLVVGAYDGPNGGLGTGDGAAYLYLGPITADLSAADDGSNADWWALGRNSDRMGRVFTVADLDNDGQDDLVASEYQGDTGNSNSGSAFIFNGPLTSYSISGASDDVELYGEGESDNFGLGSAAGDLNGDGVDDLIIGAPNRDSYKGEAYVFLGPVTSNMSGSAADYQITGSNSEGLGSAIAAADLDGDGTDDLVLGAPWRSTYTGRAYIISSGDLSNGSVGGQYSTRIAGTSNYTYAGQTLASACDVNGDGSHDLLLGAPEDGGAGAAYLFHGDLATGNLDVDDADASFAGDGDDEASYSLLCGPDLNDDGTDDLAVGSPFDGSDAGEVGLFFGGAE